MRGVRDGDTMSSDAHVEVRFQHRLGMLALGVAFQTHAPWTVLFGPSGSGKSTVLRVIAGLERPESGTVRIGRTEMLDVPAHLRPLRWAAQKAVLYPHKTVAENIAFGAAGASEANEALEHFGLRALARMHPQQLSGGQAQRVGVVRAAAGARGKLLLLDEPFTGLDAAVRDRLIVDLRSWLGETPVLSVTHDVGEAFLLGAEVVRIAEGKVTGQGPVAETLEEERKRLVGLLG